MSEPEYGSDDSLRYYISRHVIDFILRETTRNGNDAFHRRLLEITDSLNHPLLIEFSILIPIRLPPAKKRGFVKSFIDEAEKKLAKVGGGVTTISSEGGWFDESGIFVKDKSRSLSTHFNALHWRPMGEVIRNLILDVQKQLKQRCVWILIDRVAHEEPINFLSDDELRELPAESEFQEVDPDFDVNRNQTQVATRTAIIGNSTNIGRTKNSFVFNIGASTQPDDLRTIESIVHHALGDGMDDQSGEIDPLKSNIREQFNPRGDQLQEDELEEPTTKRVQFEDILRCEIDKPKRVLYKSYKDSSHSSLQFLSIILTVLSVGAFTSFAYDLYERNFSFGSESYLLISAINVLIIMICLFMTKGQRNDGFGVFSHEFEKHEMGMKNTIQVPLYASSAAMVCYIFCLFSINYTFLIYLSLVVIFSIKLNQHGLLNTVNMFLLTVYALISEVILLFIWFFLVGFADGFGSMQPEIHATMFYSLVCLVIALPLSKAFRDGFREVGEKTFGPTMDHEQLYFLNTLLTRTNWQKEFPRTDVDTSLIGLAYFTLRIYGCHGLLFGSQRNINSILSDDKYTAEERIRNIFAYQERELMKFSLFFGISFAITPLVTLILGRLFGQPRVLVFPDTRTSHDAIRSIFSEINSKYAIDFYTHNLYDVRTIDFDTHDFMFPSEETYRSTGLLDTDLFTFDLMTKYDWKSTHQEGFIGDVERELDSILRKINANRH